MYQSNLLHQVTSECQPSKMISQRSNLPHTIVKPHQNKNTIYTIPNQ